MPAPRRRTPGATTPASPGAPRVAVVVSRYNRTVTDRLLEGALAVYRDQAGPNGSVEVFDAPGAYELPTLAHAAASTGRFRGVLALGCVIKGQTRHDEYINAAVASGLVQASIATGVPCAFGVITAENPEQATDRAGGAHGNKGEEGMRALLDTISELERIRGAGALPRAGRAPRQAGLNGTPAPARRPLPDKAARPIASAKPARSGGRS